MVTGLNHVTLSVADIDRAFRFYNDILGFTPVARWYKGAYLSAGDLWLCLTLEAELSDRPLNSSYDHIAFSVSACDFESLCSRLIAANAHQWQQNRSEGDSLYFMDPDVHKLEIHVSDLESRLVSLQQNPPADLVLFDTAH